MRVSPLNSCLILKRWLMINNRPYYFGAGPAAIPTDVLIDIQQELLNWQGTGLSILEWGHRTPEFMDLMMQLESLFRSLLQIPDHYHILFMGDPARSQFGMIPMNLLAEGQQAGYWVTGLWSDLAFQEAVKLKQAYRIETTQPLSEQLSPTLKDHTAYVYCTPNETVNGVRFEPPSIPVPLVADMTSCLLMEPLDIERYGLIFAGVQKNLANAGLTVVILADHLLKSIQQTHLPTMWDYRTWVSSRSLFVTPPTFNCYVMLKMLHWVKAQGGVETLHTQNLKKAKTLYDYLDQSTCFVNEVNREDRSFINVPFRCVDAQKEPDFLAFAQQRGLIGLAGHRTLGGLRASLYNAMPLAGVIALVECMREFEETHGH